MTSIDLMILLENYTIDSGACTDDIMTLKGYIGRLIKMLYAKLKHDARAKLEAERSIDT